MAGAISSGGRNEKNRWLRVLGVDPAATGPTGYGIVESDGRRCRMLHYGALKVAAKRQKECAGAALQDVHALLCRLIEEFSPDAMALESVFTALNMGTALRLAEVRGVILLAAAQNGVLVYSYAPREVKASVTGHGHADKRQMQLMIRALLSMKETPEPSDAADALAVALCHVQSETARAPRRGRFHRIAKRNSTRRRNAWRVATHRIDAMKNSLLRFFLLIAAACLAASVALSIPTPSGAKLTFRRVFKGSSPEFIEITVREDSDTAAYEIRQLDEDPGSLPFQVSTAWRTKMFDLAAQLKHFQGQDLDVHRKIANLGEKTFRWESGAEIHEAKFNYTLNSAASQLLQIFEGLARQQEHVDLISRRMKYDRLGINDALLQFESDLNLVPLLDQIAGDSRFVDITRQRARSLAERIRHQG
ncbi:MAG: crossover junction endodeoxyribonuclease RuvC [Acidobacteria bacterium]|nr:MAG: crossover junction endodeoxyribonuclease RuvC [Acidobacteriota bacterium]